MCCRRGQALPGNAVPLKSQVQSAVLRRWYELCLEAVWMPDFRGL